MKRLVTTLAFIALAGPAFAFQCPADIARIDAAIEAGTSLSEEDLAMVIELRDEGAAQHEAGEHAASVETLAQALELLGLDDM